MGNNNVYERVVCLCGVCEGHGFTGQSVCVDYHNREYETEYSPCPACKASGRMVRTTKVTFEAFNGT